MDSTKFSYATATNVGYIEEQYEQFRKNPALVEDSWRKFFEGYEFAISQGAGQGSSSNKGGSGDQEAAKVEAYINAYRVLGHLSSHLNPLAPKPPLRADMNPASHGLKDVNKTRKFIAANLPTNTPMTFDEITLGKYFIL